jgi:hypothetical protein
VEKKNISFKKYQQRRSLRTARELTGLHLDHHNIISSETAPDKIK